MRKPSYIAYLAENRSDKIAFFEAVAADLGQGARLQTWPLSLRGYPETHQRASDCLTRAKRQPKSAIGRWLKLAFLKGRYNWSRRYFERNPNAFALCWQGLTGTRRAFMEGAKDAGARRLFAELAPLPNRRTLDPHGVNAEGSVSRDPDFYNNVLEDADLLAEIKGQFVARSSRRADVKQGQIAITKNERFLFVPLQVPNDSQISLFAGWCGSLAGFIDALAEASRHLPDGWHLRLKEHPSSKIPVTPLINQHIASGARFVLDNETDSFAQIRASEGVVTINSSMGLQAMFWDKPVVVTGEALYTIDGVVTHAADLATLSEVCSNANALTFDGPLRRRVLTWLARDYYVVFDGKALLRPFFAKDGL